MFVAVPISYVFEPYLSVVAVGVMFSMESLLYVSWVREGGAEYPGKLSEGVILPELISVFLLPISSPMVSLWNLK